MSEREKIKSVNDLRSILCNEIDKLRAGKTTPVNVNAITNATGKVLSSIKLEMEYYKLAGLTPDLKFIKALPKPSSK
jgi:hypothetical protein